MFIFCRSGSVAFSFPYRSWIAFTSRLDLLHLPHRHHALVPQREHHGVDEEREDDDRPAVVADVAVDPLQRAQQRHGQEVEHPEVDRARRSFAVDRLEHVEVLRAEEEPRRRSIDCAWRTPNATRCGVFFGSSPAGAGSTTCAYSHAHHPLRQRHRDEVLVVHAGRGELALLDGLLVDLARAEPLHLVVADDDPLGLLDRSGSRAPGTWSPRPGPHSTVGFSARSPASPSAVEAARCRLAGSKVNALRADRPAASLYSKTSVCAAPVASTRAPAVSARQLNSASFSRAVAAASSTFSVERPRRGVAGHVGGHQLLRLASAGRGTLQRPALQPGAAVREDRANRAASRRRCRARLRSATQRLRRAAAAAGAGRRRGCRRGRQGVAGDASARRRPAAGPVAGAAGACRFGLLGPAGFRTNDLVGVEHQERQEDRDEKALFHDD